MDQALQIILNGIMAGAIYVLIALGLTLIFSIMNVLNFAHGEMYMLGGFAVYYFSTQLGINYFIALIVAMLGVGLFGVIIEKVIFRPFRGQFLPGLIVSLGLAFVLQVSALLVFGATDKSVPTVFPGILKFWGISFPVERMVVMLICTALVFGLYFLLQSKAGRAMRAVSQDKDAAALCGINIDNISSLGFGLGCVLAAAAGALMVPVFYVNPYTGTFQIMKAFIVIILGGLGSLPGAVLGGLILGLVESVASSLISIPAASMVAFVTIMLVLLIKPSGLLGHE
jgi:branched-chain amino acid transport system permease protein